MTQHPDQVDDQEIQALADLAKQEDTQAQSRLITLLYSKIYRYVYYRVNTREDVEDLTNDVFVRMLDSIQKQQGYFLAWIYQIASNRIVDYYRKRSVRSDTSAVGETIEFFESNSAPIEQQFLREELRKGIQQLTADQQEVVLLRFVEGYQANEVAELLDKTPEAVRALQFRALKQLRKILPEQ